MLSRNAHIYRKRKLRLAAQAHRAYTNSTVNTATQMLLTILNNIDCWIILLHVNGTIDYINHAVEKICGQKLSEMRGKSFFTAFPSIESHEDFILGLRDTLIRKRPCQHESFITDKQGQSILIQWICNYLFIDGLGDRIIISGIDITRIRHTQEQLRLYKNLDTKINQAKIEEILSRFLDAIFSIKEMDYGAIYILNNEKWVIGAQLKRENICNNWETIITINHPFMLNALEGKTSYNIIDTLSNPGIENATNQPFVFAAIPIKYDGKVVGILQLLSTKREHISMDIQYAIANIANKIGDSINSFHELDN